MPAISDADWKPIEIVPYGAVLHVPADWEALPPVPANGPEILRAAGGAGLMVLVFKMPVRTPAAMQVASTARERLAAHGYADFTLAETRFAGQPGAVLEFVTRDDDGTVTRRMREYFAVRGNVAFALATGSTTGDEHEPLIEQIAQRFELTE
jgi:hypothetical protein